MRVRYLLELGVVNKRALPLIIEIAAEEMEWWNRNPVRLLQELQMLIDSNAGTIFQFNDRDGDADAARRAQTKKQGGKSLIVGKLLQFTYELRMTGDLEIEKYDKSIGAMSCDNASRAPKKEGAENNNFKHLPLLNYALECTVHPCKLRPAASNDPDAQDQHVDQ